MNTEGPPPRRRIAVVDLDGTLAQYDGWRGPEHIGDPIPHARDAMLELESWGWIIHVWTVRGGVGAVHNWLLHHRIPYDGVNTLRWNSKDSSTKPIATVYFDDRDAHCVGRGEYDWVRAMKRVRKVYQPRPLTTEIDDASAWAFLGSRFMRRVYRLFENH